MNRAESALFAANDVRTNDDATRHAQVYGDRSALAREMQQAGPRLNLAHNLDSWLKSEPHNEWLASGVPESIPIVKAVVSMISAADVWHDADPWSTATMKSFQGHVSAAWDKLQQAFGLNEKGSIPPANLYDKDKMERTKFEKDAWFMLKGATSDVAYWTSYDLLLGWCGGTVRSRYMATTPVAIVDRVARKGYILWLTVELFPSDRGGPFTPDLRYLGLTSIGAGKESFFEATQSVWAASGLARHGWRGRWRLESVCPNYVKSLCNDLSYSLAAEDEARDLFPAKLAERSAEVSILCALLAASGDPAGDRGGGTELPSEPLDPGVLITATLNETWGAFSGRQSLLEHPVGHVADDGLRYKINAAFRGHIGRVLLSSKQRASKEYEALGLSDPTYGNTDHKVSIKSVSTVGDALNEMLLQNKYLRAYQQDCRNNWLKQWDGDTGRATALDHQPWNEELRQAALAEQAKRRRP